MDELKPKTRELLDRMERCSLLPHRWNDRKIRECIRKICEMTDTFQPKEIVFCEDVFDQRIARASTRAIASARASAARASAARASASASASAARASAARASAIASASAARAIASAARAIASTRARAIASDYDFDWFAGEVELRELGETHSKKYIEIMMVLLEAKEAGLGYLIDDRDTNILYIAPNPVVKIEENQFHSELGPAIKFATKDLYFLKGIRLEKDLWQKIVNRTISTEGAIKLENTEHRALALQYLGGEKLEQDLGGVEVGKDNYGRIVELTKLQDSEGKNYRYYVAIDPSKDKPVYLRTRPDISSPEEAMTLAYHLGRWGITYQPTLRT